MRHVSLSRRSSFEAPFSSASQSGEPSPLNLSSCRALDQIDALSARELSQRERITVTSSHHEPGQMDFPGLVQRMAALCILDPERDGLSLAEAPAGAASGACSHGAENMEDAHGAQYRVKFNKYGAKASFEEVLSASILALIGVPHTPEVKVVALSERDGTTLLKIASRRVENFCDWGVFLLERGQLWLSGADRESYDAVLARFAHHEDQIEKLLEMRPDLRRELEQPKRAISELEAKSDLEFVSALLSIQKLRAAQNAARAELLAMLPASFTEGLRRAFYAGEVVANWDFANHELANSGWVVSSEQMLAGLPPRVDAISVDFGNSGLNGFKGLDKVDSKPFMREPARLDDAYFTSHAVLNSPVDAREAGRDEEASRRWVRSSVGAALQGATRAKDPVLERGADFESVSATFGLVGALPRSAVFSHLMKDVIDWDREGRLSSPPDPALEVAFRLFCLPEGALESHVKAFHAAVRTLPHPFGQEAPEARESESIARQWGNRAKAIVGRAGEAEIEAWRNRRPDVASRIELEVRRGLERFGHSVPQDQPLAHRHRRASSESLSQSNYS